ncbi:hypothetical protein HUU61_24410 [Rhodopseudomonas palustris]|nr:hypothetical protein [Rhodopseudomonas palustris]
MNSVMNRMLMLPLYAIGFLNVCGTRFIYTINQEHCGKRRDLSENTYPEDGLDQICFQRAQYLNLVMIGGSILVAYASTVVHSKLLLAFTIHISSSGNIKQFA